MTMLGPVILAVAAFLWALGGEGAAFVLASFGVIAVLFDAWFAWEERQEREWRRRFDAEPWKEP